MSELFKKLNLKDQARIAVLNAPESFDAELAQLEGVEAVRRLGAKQTVGFAIAFAITQAELDRVSKALIAADAGDATLWVAYPKGASKRYRCEFNRDNGWHVLGAAGYEGVRMVAIDADWSALRFRKAERIKTMRRDPSRTISAAGKHKSSAA
jgi:hypothetical protein